MNNFEFFRPLVSTALVMLTRFACIQAGYRDAQSTGKSVFYGCLSLVSVYGQKNDLWMNFRIFLNSARLLPTDPIALSTLAVFYGKTNDFWTNLRIFSY